MSTPTDEQINQAAQILSKLEPGYLPTPIFDQVMKIVVTSTVEAVVLNKRGDNYFTYLTRREDNDPIWPGMLHIPGVLIRPSDPVGDDFRGPLNRLIDTELSDLTLDGMPQLMVARYRHTPRGREIARVHWVLGSGGSDDGWYSLDSLQPDDLINDHHALIAQAIETAKQAAS